MNITPINIYNSKEQLNFGHHCDSKSKSTPKEKAVALSSAIVGTAIACAIMAKHAGYSLKPSKMFGTSLKPAKIYEKIKKSYLGTVDMEAPQVCAFGAGSCIGGLAGGYMLDKDPVNRKAKRREAVMQIGNISIPILMVKFASELTGKKFGKLASSFASIGAVFVGVITANYLMNQLANLLFHNKDEARKVKTTDFSAHLDDFVLAATYIFPRQKATGGTKTAAQIMGDVVHGVGRLVPAALVVPGYQIGIKKAHNNT